MFRKKDEIPTTTPRPLPAGGTTGATTAEPARPAPAQSTPPSPAARPATGSPAKAAAAARAAPDAAGGKRLIVGQGLSLSGDITACDLLVVEGSVQVTLNETRAIEIAETGRFTNGKAAVEEATISGVYEGDLTVRGKLLVRGTGRVDGNIRYGELEVERGGRLTGTVALLSEPGPSLGDTPAKPSTPAAAPTPAAAAAAPAGQAS